MVFCWGQLLKRSGGVTASAIVAIVGSLVALLFAGLMFMALALPRRLSGEPHLRASLLRCGILFLVLGGWGIATAVGLFRLRVWSRISILVFSGILAITNALAAVMIAIVPFPKTSNAAAVSLGVRAGIAAVYGFLALLGGGWLYFFNRETTKAQFISSERKQFAGERQRPLSVSIIAIFFLLVAAGLFIVGFLPAPANFLGFLIGGTAGHVLYLGYGTVTLLLGIGLLRLRPAARLGAIAYSAFFILSGVLFVALPGFGPRVRASLTFLPADLRPAEIGEYIRATAVCIVLGAAIYLVPIWFLVRCRAFTMRAAGERAAE